METVVIYHTQGSLRNSSPAEQGLNSKGNKISQQMIPNQVFHRASELTSQDINAPACKREILNTQKTSVIGRDIRTSQTNSGNHTQQGSQSAAILESVIVIFSNVFISSPLPQGAH